MQVGLRAAQWRASFRIDGSPVVRVGYVDRRVFFDFHEVHFVLGDTGKFNRVRGEPGTSERAGIGRRRLAAIETKLSVSILLGHVGAHDTIEV